MRRVMVGVCQERRGRDALDISEMFSAAGCSVLYLGRAASRPPARGRAEVSTTFLWIHDRLAAGHLVGISNASSGLSTDTHTGLDSPMHRSEAQEYTSHKPGIDTTSRLR